MLDYQLIDKKITSMVSVRMDCQSYVVRVVTKTVYQGVGKGQDENNESNCIRCRRHII